MAEEEFIVKPHTTLPDKQMVECWRGNEFVAAIYPHEDGIRIISKYMTDIRQEAGILPAAIIVLELESEVPGHGKEQPEDPGIQGPTVPVL